MKNLNIDEYHHPELQSHVLEGRDKYIARRWDQLYDKLKDDFNRMLNFLMIANLVGCLSVISILGFSEPARQMPGFRWVGLFFFAGFACVGILRAIIVHRAADFFNRWRKDAELYHSEKIPFSELTANDDRRTRTCWIEFATGYLSGGCFIAAAVLYGISIFKL